MVQHALRENKLGFEFYLSPSVNWPAHIHENLEIIFVREGGCTAYCQGKEYALGKNSVFLVPPNQVHRYTNHQIGTYYILCVKPELFLHFGNFFTENQPTIPLYNIENGDDTLLSLLDAAYEEYADEGHSVVVNGYITAFLGKLIKHYSFHKADQKSDTLMQIIYYCSEHYKENITVATVATALHISRSSVSHIFSTRLSMNFCDYINSLRLSEAIKLLQNRDLSISDVAAGSGFSTIRTFNRAFQKQYGVNPSEYRKIQ